MANAEYLRREHVIALISKCQEKIGDDKDYDISGSPESKDGAEAAVEYILNHINDIPTADVQPERHGKWIYSYDSPNCEYAKCSVCEYTRNPTTQTGWNYCPSCGAKMDGNSKSDNWIATSERLPPENQIVDTKIEDEKGRRNEDRLVFSNNLWWLPDKSMYVYYSPTHWRLCENTDGGGDKC